MGKLKPSRISYPGKRAEDKRKQSDPLVKRGWPRLDDDAVLFGKRIHKLTDGAHASCHIVMGSDPEKAPPVFVWEGTPRSAAYIALSLMVGEIEPYLYVIPRCGTKGCINPNHLMLRTDIERRSFYAKQQHERILKEKQNDAYVPREKRPAPTRVVWPPLKDDAVLFGQRIQRLVEGPHAGCMVISGCEPDSPPPAFMWEGARRNAAYISMNIMIGEIEPHLYVLPRCGTKGCVNPSHLILRDETGRNQFYAAQRKGAGSESES